MRTPHLYVIVIATLCGASLSAQSLADLAKKTAADREKAKATTPAATPKKVYTDEDIKKIAVTTPGVTSAGPVVTAPPAPADAPPPPPPPGDTAATTALLSAAADAKKDEPYWRGKFTPLWNQLDYDGAQLIQASRRVDTYRAALDSTQRAINGEIYVDRTLKQQYLNAIDEESRLRGAVAAGRRQLADLEEDARRANVPPGWYLRR